MARELTSTTGLPVPGIFARCSGKDRSDKDIEANKSRRQSQTTEAWNGFLVGVMQVLPALEQVRRQRGFTDQRDHHEHDPHAQQSATDYWPVAHTAPLGREASLPPKAQSGTDIVRFMANCPKVARWRL